MKPFEPFVQVEALNLDIVVLHKPISIASICHGTSNLIYMSLVVVEKDQNIDLDYSIKVSIYTS